MEKEKRLKYLIIGLVAVAVILVAVLVWLWIDRDKMLGGLTDEKEQLTEQMEQLKTDYDGLAVRMGSGAEFGKVNIKGKGLTTIYDSLNDQLSKEREKVNELLVKIKNTDAKNRKQIREYEKELETLRAIARGYIIQIDSLNQLNMALRKEVEEVRGEARESQQKYKTLQTTTDEYAKQVQIGSVVKGRDFSLAGITASGKETDRSSRTVKLKTCLNLMDNTIAAQGPKRVYVRIKSPDGILMTGSQQQIFSAQGEQMIYSAFKEVDYQGIEVSMNIYFTNNQPFEKGVYSVDIYTEEGKLGSAELTLR
ncbi:MAG: hypothetical protein WCX48_05830 [Bacteroidales bacterium]